MQSEDAPVHDRPTSFGPTSLFVRVWAGFLLLLLLATWKLWTPQSEFPQVPLFTLFTESSGWIDWGLFGLIVIALIGLLVGSPRPQRARLWLGLFVAGMLGLIALNQHRLQPWAWQACLIGAVAFWNARRMSVVPLGWLAISIYLFSAISKFDYQFVHTVGRQMLEQLVSWGGGNLDGWTESQQRWAVLAFPTGELLVGLGLVFRWTRRPAVVAALLLHLMLLAILGPFGMQHQPAVLLWNLFFMAQAVLLFWWSPPPTTIPISQRAATLSPLGWVYLVVLLLPVLEWFGAYDHWPAWSLYSPRSSRATIEIHRADVEKLPDRLREMLREPDDDSPWQRLDLARWSIESLAVPIYPQDRFQVGMARALDLRYDLDRSVRVTVLSMAHPIDGHRTTWTYSGRSKIVAAGDRFRGNSQPRSLSVTRDER